MLAVSLIFFRTGEINLYRTFEGRHKSTRFCSVAQTRRKYEGPLKPTAFRPTTQKVERTEFKHHLARLIDCHLQPKTHNPKFSSYITGKALEIKPNDWDTALAPPFPIPGIPHKTNAGLPSSPSRFWFQRHVLPRGATPTSISFPFYTHFLFKLKKKHANELYVSA